MGGGLTKQELVARLDALDREEIEINKELRTLQLQLNDIVPEDERIEVKPLSSEENVEEVDENQNEEMEEEEMSDIEKEVKYEDVDDDIGKVKKQVENLYILC